MQKAEQQGVSLSDDAVQVGPFGEPLKKSTQSWNEHQKYFKQ